VTIIVMSCTDDVDLRCRDGLLAGHSACVCVAKLCLGRAPVAAVSAFASAEVQMTKHTLAKGIAAGDAAYMLLSSWKCSS
jgi:hypothetical protein